ncbi:MAG: ABC transporter permease [Elusimicrobia bacterium]|nr:ABC transporter permease [Elusimicrobiota bacterium]
MDSLTRIFTLSLLTQTVRISVPYVLAALGATISELGGVVNIGLEGIILTGAFCSVLGNYYSGNPWVGIAAGVAGGIAAAWIHAVVSIKFRANQIISGLAINILAVGATKFFLKFFFHSSSNSGRISAFSKWDIPLISNIPLFGDLLSNPLILLSIFLVAAAYIFVYKTTFGLRLRAVGENPECADTLGINVFLTRYAAVLISGALAALGGVWLAYDQHQFTDGMSGGRGYIALTAMIFGKWNPLLATLAALFFGFAEASQIQLQTMGLNIPVQFIQMIPYLLTIIVLAGTFTSSASPSADGVPYEKE